MLPTTIIANQVSLYQYGKALLKDVSFQLEAGHHLLITGTTGSGKTTLAKALKGEILTQGTIHFTQNGMNVKPVIAMVSQSATLKNLSNTSQLYYQQRFNSIDAADAPPMRSIIIESNDEALMKKAEYWMSRFGIQDRKDTPVIQLSNGELKKAQLIRHLLLNPDILILDNIYTGIDTRSRVQLSAVLEELAQKGVTFIAINNIETAPSLFRHVLELHNGQVKSYGLRSNYLPVQIDSTNATINFPLTEKHTNTAPVIEMQQVQIKYGTKTILQDITWRVMQGDTWWIKGANGAGKSTLISLITADNPQAYAQQLFLFGRKRGSGESIWDIKKNIGFVSPELHKYFDTTITVAQTIASGLFDTIGLFRKLNNAEQDKVNKWLSYFNLEKLATKNLAYLSAGEQRLTLIARAVIKNPPLLILDEACQALDQQHISIIKKMVNTLHQSCGTTIIYTSHFEEEIPSCINKQLLLEEQSATITNLIKNITPKLNNETAAAVTL